MKKIFLALIFLIFLGSGCSSLDYQNHNTLNADSVKNVKKTEIPQEYKDDLVIPSEVKQAVEKEKILEDTQVDKSITSEAKQCCKYCTKGKACGDSCISRNYTCHKGVGCACNTY